MGAWADRVVPRMVDAALGTPEIAALRREALTGTRGRVVEIGYGSGANDQWYPEAVTEVVAVEPSDGAWRRAATGARRWPPVRRVRAGAAGTGLPRAWADAAVSTFVLCTVEDPAAVLAELRRVLAPGATLHFAEHRLADGERSARWQRRLTPLQRRLAAGCHLDRPVVALVEAAGFGFERVRHVELAGAGPLRHLVPVSVGMARAPSAS